MRNIVVEADLRGAASERKFEAFVRLLVAQGSVETVGLGALLVGGQLGQDATPRPAALVRVLHQTAADALAAQRAVHPHGLDLEAGGAVARDPRDERELHDADHVAVELRHDQLVVRARGDGVESLDVRFAVAAGAAGGDGIVGNELDDPFEVVPLRLAKVQFHGRHPNFRVVGVIVAPEPDR